MFSVYYSDEEHDNLYFDDNSLFEVTCEFYFMMDDLEEGEWITIKDEDENILREFFTISI